MSRRKGSRLTPSDSTVNPLPLRGKRVYSHMKVVQYRGSLNFEGVGPAVKQSNFVFFNAAKGESAQDRTRDFKSSDEWMMNPRRLTEGRPLAKKARHRKTPSSRGTSFVERVARERPKSWTDGMHRDRRGRKSSWEKQIERLIVSR